MKVDIQIQCTTKSLNQCDRACAGCLSRVTSFLDQIHGDGAVMTQCIPFAGDKISGFEVLELSGLDINYEVNALGAGGKVHAAPIAKWGSANSLVVSSTSCASKLWAEV